MNLKFVRGLSLSFIFITLTFGQQNRVAQNVNVNRIRTVRGTIHPLAQPQFDQGPVDAGLDLPTVTLMFKPSANQQANLDQVLAELQNPTSPNFRNWLTPEQYADRFGVSDDDIAKTVAWLQSEGLNVRAAARGRGWITFSGNAGRVGAALHTELHRFRVNGELRYANTTLPSVPEALEDIVGSFHGLDDFQEASYHREALQPSYTSGSAHGMVPDDFATIYNVNPLYDMGVDGTGQKIAIIGRTDIALSDIRLFRSLYGLPTNAPQVVLTGTDPGTSSGDLGEADLDLEWSGAVARGAKIIYVNSTSVLTSFRYAVDNNLAPVISLSYGSCEQIQGPAFRAVVLQAAAQGITTLAASGDSGAAGCDAQFSLQQASKGLGVSIYAAFPEVTGVGGTMFDDKGGIYWSPFNDDNFASALGYIPEKAWNENGPSGLAGSGGGASIFFPKPGWQSGPGVPDDHARDVPDVSLSSAAHTAASVITAGRSTFFFGTSVAAPSMAGIVALLNQYLVKTGAISKPGLGNINPTLYRLAQSNPSVFHDVTSGDIIVPCVQSSLDCINGKLGFNAGPGYDLATGLGSVDAFALATNWAAAVGRPTSVTLTSDKESADNNTNVTLTATVTGVADGLSGTVDFSSAPNARVLGSAPLTVTDGVGTATLTIAANLLPPGTYTLAALYSGNAIFNGASGFTTLTVTTPTSGSSVAMQLSPPIIYIRPPDANGFNWPVTIIIGELAGVPTTLTSFSVNGVDLPLATYFPNPKIPAKGLLSVTLGYNAGPVDVTRVYALTGQDADGQTWKQQITANFYAQSGVSIASMRLLSAAGAVQQDNTNQACPFLQPVFLQEQGGYATQITKFTAGSIDLTSKIQQIFGTSRLAPYGVLQGTVCLSFASNVSSLTYQVTGLAENSATVSTSLVAGITAPSPTTTSVSASPSLITTQSADSVRSATATLDLNFASGAPSWTATVLPTGRTSDWLKITASGTGSARLTVQTNPTGLSDGVYNATIVIRSTNASPQYISVPVFFTVGTAAATQIDGVSNTFTGGLALAPGMLASIYGLQLAPQTQHAPSLPLPISIQGVSVTVNGVTAPLLDILPNQLNIQIPYETAAGPAVLGVNNNGQIASYPILIAPAAPGQWPYFLTAAGKLTTSAKPNDVLVTFITGEGETTPALANGTPPVAGTVTSKLPVPKMPLTVTVGGVPAQVLFGGIPTGVAGVTQVNLKIPNVPSGLQSLVVSVGGVPAKPVGIVIP